MCFIGHNLWFLFRDDIKAYGKTGFDKQLFLPPDLDIRNHLEHHIHMSVISLHYHQHMTWYISQQTMKSNVLKNFVE